MAVWSVERRVYKGVDIGERFVRLRPKLAIPRYISIYGHPLKIRVLHDDEVNNLSISRRRSFRSQLNIRLKIPSSENLLQSSESLNDSQNSLPDKGIPRIHLTPPIPPLPSEPEKNPAVPSPKGIAAARGYCNSLDRTIPIQKFTPSTERLENRTNSSQNIHHSLPDFVSSNVLTTSSNPHFFTYPVNSTAQSGDSRVFQKTAVVSNPDIPSAKIRESGARTATTGPTPSTNYSVDCFQFPVGPASPTFGRINQDCPSAGVGNQSPPSSGDKKTCSSDKDQDSERERGKGEKGKEKKKAKKGKQAKSQNKQAERKAGPGIGECSQSSSSGQDSPSKSRRKLSVNFKRDGIGGGGHSPVFGTASFDRHDGPTDVVGTCSEFERSNSETSSRFGSTNAPRRMSSTGREKAKVPWCGCWGNGCC